MSEAPRRSWPGVRGAVALAAAIGVAVLAALRWRDLADALDKLAAADPAWLALAIGANVASPAVRGLAWAVIVRRAVPAAPRTRWVLSAFFIGGLGNLLSPARLGEVAKVAVLSRHVRGPRVAAPLAGSVVAHRLLDIAPLSALAAVVLASAGLPGTPGPGVLAGAAAGALLLVGLSVLLARRPRRSRTPEGRLARALSDAREGLAALRTPGAAAGALALQAVGFSLEVAGAFALLHALGIPAGWTEAMLVVVATSALTAVPLWPGNVGVFQLGLAAALTSAGVPTGAAIAYGLALQGVEVISATGTGASSLAVEGLGRRPLSGRDDGRGAAAGARGRGGRGGGPAGRCRELIARLRPLLTGAGAGPDEPPDLPGGPTRTGGGAGGSPER